jgi:predicted GIY-YIG superfamily endonuclease
MFWVYILKCGDNSYYTGHTDNLEKRVGEHLEGLLYGYTRTRHPLKFVFAEEFQTRYEALSRERQIKGWSRKKKEALISSDWELLKKYSKSYGPSTSSGRTVKTVKGDLE